MAVFAMGDFETEADSMEQALEIFQERSRLEVDRNRRDILVKVKHGHMFGIFRKCECGLSAIDYLSQRDHEDLCAASKMKLDCPQSSAQENARLCQMISGKGTA